MMSEFDCDAFISYRRSDGTAVARWLRRALVGYRLPRALRSRHADKLRVYLDTVYERATSDFYERSIKPALQSSRFLIVVATPDVMRSRRAWRTGSIAKYATSRAARTAAMSSPFVGPAGLTDFCRAT